MTREDFEKQCYTKDFIEFLDEVYGEETYLQFPLLMISKMHFAYIKGKSKGYRRGSDDGYTEGYQDGVKMAQLGLE